MENKSMDFVITKEQSGARIDKFLTDSIPQWSRSLLQKLLGEGQVLVNGSTVSSHYKIRNGDCIHVCDWEPQKTEIVPEEIPLDILYEDDWLLVINKPKGMVVHPSAGHTSGTLVNAVMYHCDGQLSGINGQLRPGIVHRIDKDTTGALVVCKDDQTHRALALQLKEHTIDRKYRAIVMGRLTEDGSIDAPIGRHPVDRKKMAVNYRNGKQAVTHYHVLDTFRDYTYLECSLETGRTHQIRAHMASIGHPLLGDTSYTKAKWPWKLEGQVLHAMTLGFMHPETGEKLFIEAPLPPYFSELLETLSSQKL